MEGKGEDVWRDLVSQSVRAAITKYCKLGGLNNTQLFLIDLEAGKVKTKVPATSVPDDRTLFPVCRWALSCCVCTRQTEREQTLWTLLIRALIPL